MRIVNMKGISKKEVINATSGEYSVKKLCGLDSVKIYGGAICENTNNVNGQITGLFILKTDVGVVSGISVQVYNVVESILDLFSSKDLMAGLDCKFNKSGEDGKEYITVELL